LTHRIRILWGVTQMKASELIKLLQKEIKTFGCDPYVTIEHPNGDWNSLRDVWCGKRGFMHGYIGDKPAIVLSRSTTLLDEEMSS